MRAVEALRAAVGTDLAAIGPLLAEDVQWGGGCRSRDDVDRSVAFYELLGFAVNDSFEHDGERVWVWLESEEMRVTDPDGYHLMIAQITDDIG